MMALKHYISITFKENALGCHILIGKASIAIHGLQNHNNNIIWSCLFQKWTKLEWTFNFSSHKHALIHYWLLMGFTSSTLIKRKSIYIITYLVFLNTTSCMASIIPQPLMSNQRLNMLFLILSNMNNSFNDSYPKIDLPCIRICKIVAN